MVMHEADCGDDADADADGDQRLHSFCRRRPDGRSLVWIDRYLGIMIMMIWVIMVMVVIIVVVMVMVVIGDGDGGYIGDCGGDGDKRNYH